jgi:hypothetical protein
MRYTYASVDPQQVNSMLDDFTLDTAPDQNSPEQFGYSPPLRRARDAIQFMKVVIEPHLLDASTMSSNSLHKNDYFCVIM